MAKAWNSADRSDMGVSKKVVRANRRARLTLTLTSILATFAPQTPDKRLPQKKGAPKRPEKIIRRGVYLYSSSGSHRPIAGNWYSKKMANT